jgi:hypothetical protein
LRRRRRSRRAASRRLEGIFVHNADHGLYKNNRTEDNADYGIHGDPPPSDDNIFIDNSSHGNGTSDFFNEGTGNCDGGGHSFGTALGQRPGAVLSR